MIKRITFVRAAGNQNFGLDIEVPVELRTIELLDGVAQPDATLWVGIVVGGNRTQGFCCSLLDPVWWCEVHVTLTKVDACWWKIGSTTYGLSMRSAAVKGECQEIGRT